MFNSHMRYYVTQWSCSDHVVTLTVCTDTLSQEKKNLHTKLEVMYTKNYYKLTRETKALTSLTRHLHLQREF